MNVFKVISGEQPGILKRLKNYKNKGQFGEYLIEYAIHGKIDGYYKTVKNVYIPTDKGTTEIDIILIHEKGIFVIESKNYAGWIYGSEEQQYWTQSLNKNTKHKFYNPILQNKNHIKHLVNAIPAIDEYIKSYIVFSNECFLKKIPNTTNECLITKRDFLIQDLIRDIENSTRTIQHSEIDRIYTILYEFEQVDEKTKQEHIDRIKR